MSSVYRGLTLLLVLAGVPTLAVAQPALPAPVVEFTGGYAGFADDATVSHGMLGSAFRVYVTPRLSVGPEVQYMIGPDTDRDLIVTGNATFDLLPPSRRTTPFVVAGAGLFRHSQQFAGRTFSSTEGAFTGGGGVRTRISDRVSAAAEVRAGWELHYRVSGTVAVALGR